jgi:cyclohexa-1,5-dienecarbonyl-CoA hydratase
MAVDAATAPVRVERGEGGALWRVFLARPKANVLDTAMTAELAEVWRQAAGAPALKAIVLEGEGPNFSFGASVPEHLPDRVAAMLGAFHAMFRALAAAGVATLAAVRGQCLGGGLELAAFCNRVFAAPGARLGQPEIRLGVLAPVASVLLPHRIGRAAAEDLCLSGRTLDAAEALRLGLADEVADDPAAAALAYAKANLLPHSAAALRCAQRALRAEWHRVLFAALAAAERLYLDELMATADAVEGVRAFLEKRSPQWRDR